VSIGEKIFSSAALFLLANLLGHYLAAAGGAQWGTMAMGFILFMANTAVAGIVLFVWMEN
jgi:hypothetical protein